MLKATRLRLPPTLTRILIFEPVPNLHLPLYVGVMHYCLCFSMKGGELQGQVWEVQQGSAT